ncbi:MAG TPA: DUF433 domain-containing protein [Polyangiaceae bacterium]|nr:DUF433 domain-containing protein [Polyangiaceae bacterium]
MKLPIVLVPHPHVRVDTNVLGGSPHVVGSRVPVRRLWAFYRGGTSVDKILKRFPQLGPAKVFDALAFALDNPEVIEADIRQEQELLELVTHSVRKKPGNDSQMELPFAGNIESVSRADASEAAKHGHSGEREPSSADREVSNRAAKTEPSELKSRSRKKPISER